MDSFPSGGDTPENPQMGEGEYLPWGKKTGIFGQKTPFLALFGPFQRPLDPFSLFNTQATFLDLLGKIFPG